MKHIIVFSVLILPFIGLYSQTPDLKIIEASEIPIDTTNVVILENELFEEEISKVNNDQDTTTATSEVQDADFPEIIIPIVNLKDDPLLASVDAKWLEFVKRYEAIEPQDMQIEVTTSEPIKKVELSTELLKQRLVLLNTKTPFHVAYNPILENLIKRFLSTRSQTMAALMSKAKYYFPLFEEKLDLYDVPLEMKYLAIVESALQPKAKSRVGATGLWQFMYSTGKMYGLEVSSYIDDRQDPVLSTEAAAKHLSDLYDIFDDWDLALAAYNSGAGNVNKAIRRAGGKRNYWNIRPFLPRETASYVPIFYATLYLFEYGNEHQIFPDDSFELNHYETDSIQIRQTITFEQIEKATGIDIALLELLNPAYKLNIIPYVSDKPYYLVLPIEYVGTFVQNEDLIYAYVAQENDKKEKPLPENITVNPQATTYRVKSGDYLGRIAEKYGVSVSKIMRWNNMRSSKLRVGQKLKIYSRNNAGSTQTNTAGKTTYYTVKSGDTLWEISRKFHNVSPEDIKKWNKLSSNNLMVGHKLKIIKS